MPQSLSREAVRTAVAAWSDAQPEADEFVPGQTPVPVSGKVVGTAERLAMVEAALDGWLTTGRFNQAFEQRLAAWFALPRALTVNSGSSANLVAVSSLFSPRLGAAALRPGDEIITVAAGFPTTVNPILQNGAIPVFVDIRAATYDVDVDRLEAARSERTRAVVLAHTLGNPFDLGTVTDFCARHGLWLIEDCCDALGSRYRVADGAPLWQARMPDDDASLWRRHDDAELRERHVGAFGHFATVSFYPAHHITMGEGGAVLSGEPELARIAESIGMRKITNHCLRHSFASHAVMRGISIRQVQEWMGHGSVVVTMKYAHLAQSHGDELIQRLCPDPEHGSKSHRDS